MFVQIKLQYNSYLVTFRCCITYTLRSVNDVTEGITQESPMGASWVIPRKVDQMV